MTLPSYASLGTVHRTKPCQEYPGSWGVYLPAHLDYPGENPVQFSDFDSALQWAKSTLIQLEEQKTEYNPRDISICWKCSDNDPRIGKIWFTPFFCAGKFDWFGQYRST